MSQSKEKLDFHSNVVTSFQISEVPELEFDGSGILFEIYFAYDTTQNAFIRRNIGLFSTAQQDYVEKLIATMTCLTGESKRAYAFKYLEHIIPNYPLSSDYSPAILVMFRLYFVDDTGLRYPISYNVEKSDVIPYSEVQAIE